MEFAFVLPVLLLIFFGLVNTVSLIMTVRRLSAAANVTASLVTLKDTSINSSEFDDIFIAAELAVRPMSAAGMRIEVYDYYVNESTNKITLRWSRNNNVSIAGGSCGFTAPVEGSDARGGSLLAKADAVVAVVCMPFVAPENRFPGMEVFSNITLMKYMAQRPREPNTLTCTDCPS